MFLNVGVDHKCCSNKPTVQADRPHNALRTENVDLADSFDVDVLGFYGCLLMDQQIGFLWIRTFGLMSFLFLFISFPLILCISMIDKYNMRKGDTISP